MLYQVKIYIALRNEELNISIEECRFLLSLTRLKILGILAIKDRSIKEISDELYLKENKVLHNLQRLIDLDLIGVTYSNERYTYHINAEAFVKINRGINEEDVSPNLAKEDWEEKVLRNYIKDEQLLSIPTKRKKRDIILKWLVQKFEIGVLYTEIEVNKILLSIHPDVATLRREFIMTKLMSREGGGGSYWRVTDSNIIKTE